MSEQWREDLASFLIDRVKEYVVDPSLDLASTVGRETLETGDAINQLAAGFGGFLLDAARRASGSLSGNVLNEGDPSGAESEDPRVIGPMRVGPAAPKRESNFLEFMRSERDEATQARARINQRRAEILRQLGIVLDPQTGQPIPTTRVRSQVTNDLLTRGPAVGVPEGYIAEEKITPESFGGLTNPDAMASYMDNTDQFRRGIQTDDRGQPLGADGLPLIGEDGQIRVVDGKAVEPMYTDTIQRAPQYFEDDVYLPLRTMSPVERQRLQVRLIRAGLAPEGVTPSGGWSAAWAQTFEGVIAHANITGGDWNTALNEIEVDAQSSLEGSLAEFITSARADFDAQFSPYRPPDKATIQDAIQDALDATLGRKPTSEEYATLFGELRDSYRAQYDADRQVAMAQFGQQMQGASPLEAIPEDLRTDEDRAAIAGLNEQVTDEFGVPTEVESVDPAARFDMKFRDLFQGQIDIQDQRADDQANQQAMSARAGSVMQRLRGGL